MDENEYETLVLKTRIDRPNLELENNPLKSMVNEVNSMLEKHAHTLCKDPSKELRYWKISNPSVPRLSALIKNHKAPDENGIMKM